MGLDTLLGRVSDPMWGIWNAWSLDDTKRIVRECEFGLTDKEVDALSRAAFAVAYKRRRLGGVTQPQAKSILVIAENRDHAECPGVGASIITLFTPDDCSGWYYKMRGDGSVQYKSGTGRTTVTVYRDGSWEGSHRSWSGARDGKGFGEDSESLGRWLNAGCPMWICYEDKDEDEMGGLKSFHKGRRW